MLTKTDQILKQFSLAKQCPMGFVSGALSQRGDLLYLAGENKELYNVRLENGALEGQQVHLTDFEIIGLACHPFSNVVAVWDENGSLGLWK